MLPVEKLSKNVLKIVSDSNCYVVENEILIDTSRERYKQDLIDTLKNQGIDPEKIRKIIFTHLHYDHIGNFDIFKNAEFFVSSNVLNKVYIKNNKNKNQLSSEIKFEEMEEMILNYQLAKKFNVKLNDVEKDIEIKNLFEIFKTPGHCISCISLLYKKDNILFTGDTYFSRSCYGRTDLPSSLPEYMKQSIYLIEKIIRNKKPIIASGHDY